jgi:hypothetical protein
VHSTVQRELVCCKACTDIPRSRQPTLYDRPHAKHNIARAGKQLPHSRQLHEDLQRQADVGMASQAAGLLQDLIPEQPRPAGIPASTTYAATLPATASPTSPVEMCVSACRNMSTSPLAAWAPAFIWGARPRGSPAGSRGGHCSC